MGLETNNGVCELWHREVLGADDHVRCQSSRDQLVRAEERLAS